MASEIALQDFSAHSFLGLGLLCTASNVVTKLFAGTLNDYAQVCSLCGEAGHREWQCSKDKLQTFQANVWHLSPLVPVDLLKIEG